jgi:CHAT domain-containing protein/Tfp pilus assembly protein PilF
LRYIAQIIMVCGTAIVLTWPGFALAQSSELNNLFDKYQALEKQGKYAEAIPFAKSFIEIAKNKFGPKSPDYAAGLNNLAGLYRLQRRYTDAEPLSKRALKVLEKVLGPDHPSVAVIINDLAAIYYAQQKAQAAEFLLKRSLVINEKLNGHNHFSAARIINNLAAVYLMQSRHLEAENQFKRSFVILKKFLGPKHRSVITNRYNLASVYSVQGSYKKAEILLKTALENVLQANSIDKKLLAKIFNDLGQTKTGQGQFDEALDFFKRSLKLKERSLIATNLNNIAEIYRYQARYSMAEIQYKRAITSGFGKTRLNALNNLAELYRNQRRFVDAEPLYIRSIALGERVLPPNHRLLAHPINNLALLYTSQGRYAEATPLFKRSLRILNRLGAEHPFVATVLNNLGDLYQLLGDYPSAERLFQQSLKIRRKVLGPKHLDISINLNNLGNLYSRQGHYAKAEKFLKNSLKIRKSILSPNHPNVAASLSNLSWLYQRQGHYVDALPLIQKTTNILRNRRNNTIYSNDMGGRTEHKKNWFYFKSHVSVAFEASQLRPSLQNSLYKEAFEIGQLAQTSSAASALLKMTARLGTNNKELAKIVRRRQDLSIKWRNFNQRLILEISKLSNRPETKIVSVLREKLSKTEARLTLLNEQLAEIYPKYTEIENPSPLGIDALKKILRTDEVLVVYQSGYKAHGGEVPAYIWLIRSDRFQMLKLDISAKELTELVSKVRSSFVTEGNLVPPFPYSYAHDLYQEIFAPIEKDLTGIKHIMVVPDGPLTGLPLSVLLSSPYEGKGKPAWLAEKYALTTLPSVSSLRALRVLAKKAGAGTEPFAGFGNPLLQGDPSNRRGISIVPIFSKGDKADASELRKLAALPETADELRIIARSLGAGNDSIYLGEKATETKVKSLDLSKTKVIAFATHGLVAGELRGQAEPGLVMTPPSTPTRDDDGVLTASEIAQLKLHPGLVILSACNTASADGTPGAEGLSGLAKAFFYAGSKSLMVSHWAVPSEAAKRLTTGMFDNLKKNPKLGLSEALRRSMMALAANDNFSHPIHWAPFVIVGEGARLTR